MSNSCEDNKISSFSFGCCETAKMLPSPTRIIVTPSLFLSNFSFRIMGDKIPVNIIVTHDVEAMRMMFPSPNATALKVYEILRNMNPRKNLDCM